jgi:hypothetical protein
LTPTATLQPAAILPIASTATVVTRAVPEHEPGADRVSVALRLAALPTATVVRPRQRQVAGGARQVRLRLRLVTHFLASHAGCELLRDRSGCRELNFRTGQRAAPVAAVSKVDPAAVIVKGALTLHVVPAVRPLLITFIKTGEGPPRLLNCMDVGKHSSNNRGCW